MREVGVVSSVCFSGGECGSRKKVWRSWGVECVGLWVVGSGCRLSVFLVQGLRFRVDGLGLRVESTGS